MRYVLYVTEETGEHYWFGPMLSLQAEELVKTCMRMGWLVTVIPHEEEK